MNGNKFASGEILRKPVEVVKGRILAGWSSKISRTLPPCICIHATHTSFMGVIKRLGQGMGGREEKG
jgi:hypothetical protein